jgi:hypothetical protein
MWIPIIQLYTAQLGKLDTFYPHTFGIVPEGDGAMKGDIK